MLNLPAKRARFVEEYLIDSNGTQAAIRAGYSPKTAQMQASQLLTYPGVADAVAAGRAVKLKDMSATVERVILELARLSFSDLRKIMDPETGRMLDPCEWDDDTAAAISSLEVVETTDRKGKTRYFTHKIKVWDKNAALEKLCKHLGVNADSPTGGVTINILISQKDIDCG